MSSDPRLISILQQAGLGLQEYTLQADLKERTWFRLGGRADVLIHTSDMSKVAHLLQLATHAGVETFTLGDGSNLVVSDAGIAGFVIDSKLLCQNPLPVLHDGANNEVLLETGAGILMEDLIGFTLDNQLEGLAHFYGLPGTLGGALFMNASCYLGDISAHFERADLLQKDGSKASVAYIASQWSYKRSPFQQEQGLITGACLRLHKSNLSSQELWQLARGYKDDRQSKGHFSAPSAGSTFKNDRSFGKPSGQLIDECGLKGLRCGDAMVALFHGNFVINVESASASDVAQLITQIISQVKTKTGFVLEPEVLFVGRGYSQ
jgi:UDP-N-acetylmuramate dehydrogenase